MIGVVLDEVDKDGKSLLVTRKGKDRKPHVRLTSRIPMDESNYVALYETPDLSSTAYSRAWNF